MRLAIMCCICAGKDKRQNPSINQLLRVNILGESLTRTLEPPGIRVEKVLVTTGFDNARHMANWSKWWDRVIEIPSDRMNFMKRMRQDPTRPWPLNSKTQNRPDGNCTVMKLHTWNLTEYDGVLAVDSDACFQEDPRPRMLELHRLGHYFVAGHERAARANDGFHAFVYWFRPNHILYRILTDKARLGDFMPFANGEQDVFENVFPVHLPETYAKLPSSFHHASTMAGFAQHCLHYPPGFPNPYRDVKGS
mmetsp:Transcript_6030/g.15435  ORF Transcript_6030/g.15435 Transcript_6030/m.15435 type:complete len:250 (+) Transcript_6030:80-829(+)